MIHQNVEALLTRINEQHIDMNFMKSLIIFSEDKIEEVKDQIASKDYTLFGDIQSASLVTKRKGSKFTKDQWLELSMLLKKYPDDYLKIRRALKISWSTFRRLVRESEVGFWKRESTHLKKHPLSILNKIKKVYIRKLVQPPTVPMTLKSI